MRLRYKPWAEEYLNASDWVLDLENISTFTSNIEGKKLFLEVGMGKGQFIDQLSKQSDDMYIGIEKYPSVQVCLIKNLEEKEILPSQRTNLRLISSDADEILKDIKDVSRIYINFPDPWPKVKHEKRRLVSPIFLKKYYKSLREDGEIEFRSDQKPLFDYFKEVLKDPKIKFKIIEESSNLHQEKDVKVTTEYEDKFVKLGNPIYFIKVIKT